jgi:cell shape-determining protein MreC
MRYLSDRSKTRRRYINFALGLVAFGLFVYYWPAIRTVAYPFAEPVMRGYGSTKGAFTLVPEFISTYFTSHKKLFDRNAELEMNIERLENQLAEKDALVREEELLLGGQAPNQTARIVMMYPIAEDITRLYSTILLSKGYREGVEKTNIVYVRGQQAVCEIVEVYDRTSLCELLSKGDRVTEAVTSSSTVTLSLFGVGGGNFISESPKGTNVLVGETVHLRSDQSFTLGTVVAVKEDEQSTGAKIYIRGAYNPIKSSVFYLRARYAP